ncbi:hypothetical protein CEUSTIGMA_g3774.t1 [Chlamydomonas eustigma]|uniref:CBS domain-containing protein n=1 Tax=Chlamydomonas eustigma TaxID=1157962 RepID=A0A250WZR5_9CHLO|nr:hypothetical protein CEUSTIGMA_g3774.t1 [Chlamydomonas eustigma]|eukprot:GAX76328.1 hypothetical protein CEUSTIGMA_g3774.t1 [Chlamydomonas eustigma]
MSVAPGFFIPTRFVWRFGGRQVHLCGSFTRWVETVPMAPVDNSHSGVFAVVVHLPPGYHQYKFIVDGKWRHDETAPFMPDPLGNVNNWLFVRRVDPATNHPISSTTAQFDSQLAAQQQPPALVTVQQQVMQQGTSPLSSSAIATSTLGIASALSPQTSPLPQNHDVDMSNAELSAVIAPIVIHNPKEPEYTRKKVSEFLHGHSAYELIPESGKVVVIDVDLPLRQAFHALHEQGIASAPLWDAVSNDFIGVISASDFISVLTRLRNSVYSGANPMSEAEMDAHTIRGLREHAALEGREPKHLAYAKPQDDLAKVAAALSEQKCSMSPILTCDPGTREIANMLHTATLSGILACLMRHFRASLASLPLLSQTLGSLPLGTWSPDAGVAHADVLPDSKKRRQWRKLQPLYTVTPNTLLTTALSMLLETGVSALPVVDEKRCLLDVYARSDITQLCRGNAYNRLQWEDVTVGQALSLSSVNPSSWNPNGTGLQPHVGAPGSLSAELQAQHHASAPQQQPSVGSILHAGPGPGGRFTRAHICNKEDTLRTVVERLALPGVRRLVVVQPETRRVEGLISLSDVASYLFV